MPVLQSTGQRSIVFARFGSIELRAHWSLLIILVLVATSIALSSSIELNMPWSAAARWAAGTLAALLLVASITLHELAHAVAARRFDIEVPRITLFAFGGMAQMTTRPTRPVHELVIAIVGPVMSIAIGILLLSVVRLPVPVIAADDLTPWAFALWVVGQANIGLAVFNLLPGTPLDGGRVLHAVVWLTTGSEGVATRRAALGGKVVGGTLAAAGLAMCFGIELPWFGSGLGGVWLILIGWFIATLADAEARSWPIEQLAQRADVGTIMHELQEVAPDTPLTRFTDGVLMPRASRIAVVRTDGRAVGVATLRDVLRVPANRRDVVTVEHVMTPWRRVHSIPRSATVADALAESSRHEVEHLPVVDETGAPVGVISSDNLASWLALHADIEPKEPADASTGQP